MALGTALAVLVWLFGVWPPPVWWRDHWPRETALMHDAGARAALRPTALGQISPRLQRMVIIGEDSRFWTHHGVDPVEVADALGLGHGRGFWAIVRSAWTHRDRVRGASTITQQLAKNLYLSSARSVLRKAKEAVTALRLELALPKDRILELYLGVAEWGPGIWGAEAASQAYFGVPASQLGEVQAAALAATLPHPRTSNPGFRPERTLARRDLILARYRGVPVEVPAEPEEPDTTAVEPPGATPSVDSLPADSLQVDTTDRAMDSLP